MTPYEYALEVKRSRTFRGQRMSSRQRRLAAGVEENRYGDQSRAGQALDRATRALQTDGVVYGAARSLGTGVARRLRSQGVGGPSRSTLNRVARAGKRTQKRRDRMWANRMQRYGANF